MDALARLHTPSPSPQGNSYRRPTRRLLTGLRRSTTAVAVVLASLEVDHNHTAAETRSNGHENGGNRSRVAVSGQGTAGALDAAADGDDDIRLYPPALQKLGQDHRNSNQHASSSWLSLSSIRRTVDAIAVFLSHERGGIPSSDLPDVSQGNPFVIGIPYIETPPLPSPLPDRYFPSLHDATATTELLLTLLLLPSLLSLQYHQRRHLSLLPVAT